MPTQVDPRYFNAGNAFLGGVEQAGQEQRRNAMLDLEQRQQGLYEQKFAQDQQAGQAQAQQGQAERASRVAALQEIGFDPETADSLADDPDAPELIMEARKQAQPKPPGQLYQVTGPDGRPQFAPAEQAQGMQPWVKPDAPSSEAYKPQLVETTLPDGSIQKQWLSPGQSEGVKVGAPAFSRQTQISPKDLVTARNKLNVIKLARQQLNNISAKFGAIKGGMTAGKGQGWIPSPKGEAFDKSIDLMRSTLTSLTKVPGIGAMSDYETRLDQAKFPSRGDYEDVTEDNIAQLDAMLNAIETGYSDLISQGPVQAGQEDAPQAAPQNSQQSGGKRLSPAEASQLPSGTRFVGMDGIERVKR